MDALVQKLDDMRDKHRVDPFKYLRYLGDLSDAFLLERNPTSAKAVYLVLLLTAGDHLFAQVDPETRTCIRDSFDRVCQRAASTGESVQAWIFARDRLAKITSEPALTLGLERVIHTLETECGRDQSLLTVSPRARFGSEKVATWGDLSAEWFERDVVTRDLYRKSF